MEDIKKKITSLLNAAGVTGEHDLEIISDNLILIQTDQGTFKYTDKLYKQTNRIAAGGKIYQQGIVIEVCLM